MFIPYPTWPYAEDRDLKTRADPERLISEPSLDIRTDERKILETGIASVQVAADENTNWVTIQGIGKCPLSTL